MGVNEFIVADEGLAIKWLVEADNSNKTHATLQSRGAQNISCIVLYLL